MKNVIKIRIGFAVIALLGAALFHSCSPEDPVENTDQVSIDKNKMLELINSYRTSGCSCGSEGYLAPTTPVVWNNNIEKAALDHSVDMSKNDIFSHTGSDGSDAGDRLDRRYYDWITYGENIAKGYKTEEKVVEGWINSPGHCRNIMNPGFKEMGVARVGDYWTQIFGTRAP